MDEGRPLDSRNSRGSLALLDKRALGTIHWLRPSDGCPGYINHQPTGRVLSEPLVKVDCAKLSRVGHHTRLSVIGVDSLVAIGADRQRPSGLTRVQRATATYLQSPPLSAKDDTSRSCGHAEGRPNLMPLPHRIISKLNVKQVSPVFLRIKKQKHRRSYHGSTHHCLLGSD